MTRVPQWRIVWWDAPVWLSRRRPLSTLIQARTEELCESITILTQEMDVRGRQGCLARGRARSSEHGAA